MKKLIFTVPAAEVMLQSAGDDAEHSIKLEESAESDCPAFTAGSITGTDISGNAMYCNFKIPDGMIGFNIVNTEKKKVIYPAL